MRYLLTSVRIVNLVNPGDPILCYNPVSHDSSRLFCHDHRTPDIPISHTLLLNILRGVSPRERVPTIMVRTCDRPIVM